MNIENLNRWIAVLERVEERGDRINMVNWQDKRQPCWPAIVNEERLHTCGSAACAGGWLAVSPEWQDDGGLVGVIGQPLTVNDTEKLDGAEAVADWLGIHEDSVEMIMWLSPSDSSVLYETDAAEDVTVRNVLDVLYHMRDTGKYPMPPHARHWQISNAEITIVGENAGRNTLY